MHLPTLTSSWLTGVLRCAWLSGKGVLLCGLLAGFALGAELTAAPDYQIDVWQTDEGLPQSTVTSIVQTRDGYLWLGTQNGLARFDGVDFQIFNENNTSAIKNNRIVKLYGDNEGTLWVSGEGGGIALSAKRSVFVLQNPREGISLLLRQGDV